MLFKIFCFVGVYLQREPENKSNKPVCMHSGVRVTIGHTRSESSICYTIEHSNLSKCFYIFIIIVSFEIYVFKYVM